MRKLVTIRVISEINPIDGADAIEVATVDGWKVVVKKGEFEVGQRVLYFEIDSILPEGRPEFEFLMARGCKDQTTDEPGVTLRGHRLRTIKLRGQVSQGLVIPIPEEMHIVYPQESDQSPYVQIPSAYAGRFDLDADFSGYFGVMKYEKPIAPSLAGKVRGNYPSWFPKTDQERVQNCFNAIPAGETWCIEEKVEGSSITIYFDGERAGVTSRNLDLSLDQEGNTFVDVAKASGLVNFFEGFIGVGADAKIAIRGELVGPGIQDNIYKLNEFRIYIYDVWAGDHYMTPVERARFMEVLINHPAINKNIVREVPVVERYGSLDEITTVEQIIMNADGRSQIAGTLREGIVYKSYDAPVYSFKAISNKYLLQEK